MAKVRLRGGILTLNDLPLYEIRPGLFFSADGEVLDFQNATPIWRSIELHRVVFPWWQKVLLGMSLLLFPFGLFAWTITGGFNRIRRRLRPQPAFTWLARLALMPAILNAGICLLFLVIVYYFPFLIFGGWLEPTDIMPTMMKAARFIPAVITLLTAIMGAVSVGIFRSPSWPSSFKHRYALLTLGAVLFVVLLASWQVLKLD
jgi:hypothetical protein